MSIHAASSETGVKGVASSGRYTALTVLHLIDNSETLPIFSQALGLTFDLVPSRKMRNSFRCIRYP